MPLVDFDRRLGIWTLAANIGILPGDGSGRRGTYYTDSEQRGRVRVDRHVSFRDDETRGESTVMLGLFADGASSYAMTVLIEPDDAVILAHKLVETANEAYRARGQAEVIVPSGED
jgi:hypothetical protein